MNKPGFPTRIKKIRPFSKRDRDMLSSTWIGTISYQTPRVQLWSHLHLNQRSSCKEQRSSSSRPSNTRCYSRIRQNWVFLHCFDMSSTTIGGMVEREMHRHSNKHTWRNTIKCNMRSKFRWVTNLQFTLRIAFRCVLHRCKSQEIHCWKLSWFFFCICFILLQELLEI